MSKIDYLRISLIDRCNFRCLYCMPEGEELSYILKQNILTNHELINLLQFVFIPLGFTKFRLTGGEPLLRPGVIDLVRAIASLPETQDLAITTNGYHLPEMAQPLYDAGLRRLNISLDSLDGEKFDRIIGNRGRSNWARTWQGIQTAYEVGFNPLKLNVVVIPGINDSEVEDLASLTIDKSWHVRFIEFMPIGNLDLFNEKAWIPSEEIRRIIRERWGLKEGQVKGNGPADVFQIPGAKGTLGFISQMSECFCERCNRLRLSADGWLRPCLLNETGQIDLKTSLREGVSLSTLKEQVRELIAQKESINFKLRDSGTNSQDYSRTMSQIGG
ncbi:MAG: GTP 3',8-cyclase [Chroococcopsis gigantea SAG 12.99]|jgi:cyclic pyranopterin phosphate synthase|nr:GTP 3',8-cyclase MoaA [Chlorogloea purpurea SAG 13.99]MDV2999581.1 GTP 3',8-cyclase [Chroococcopsis gigantea SAG 12.99]